MSESEHSIWKVFRGEAPGPPCAQHLGWDVLEVEKGRVRIAFQARPEFLNPVGNVQGGFLAAMLDDTLGPALATTFEPDQFGPTIELKVNFLRPAKVGRLVAEGRVVHRGKSIAFMAGEIYDEGGKMLATASATAKLVKVDRSAPDNDG